MMIFFDFFLSQKFKEMVCRLLKNITKSTMENPKIWFIFRLDIILLGLGHLVNARKDVKNSKFNFNPKKKRFSKYLSVTVFGDLISTFWQKIVSFGTMVGLGCKKSQNWHFLLKSKFIDNGSIFFYENLPRYVKLCQE